MNHVHVTRLLCLDVYSAKIDTYIANAQESLWQLLCKYIDTYDASIMTSVMFRHQQILWLLYGNILAVLDYISASIIVVLWQVLWSYVGKYIVAIP